MIPIIIAALMLAHSWYPPECCNGVDCAPLEDSRVEVTPDGYRIDGNILVLYKDARVSADEHYHTCWSDRSTKPRCFFAPRGTT